MKLRLSIVIGLFGSMLIATDAQAQAFAPLVCPANLAGQSISNPLQILATTAVPSPVNVSTAWSFQAQGFFSSQSGSFTVSGPDQAPFTVAGTLYFSTALSPAQGKFVYVSTNSQYGVISRSVNSGKFTVASDCSNGQLTFLSGTNAMSFDFYVVDGTFKQLYLVGTSGQGAKGNTITGIATRY